MIVIKIMNFQFTDMQSKKELFQVIDFLHKQYLNYPNYDNWVQKTEVELIGGYKNAILAFSERKLVGDIVYQQHKKNPGFLELKNMRIHPKIRERSFAKFMLRQIEVENQNYNAIIVDAPSGLPGIISFMQNQGYTPILSRPLYDNGAPDVVMIKPIKKSKKIIIPRALEMF